MSLSFIELTLSGRPFLLNPASIETIRKADSGCEVYLRGKLGQYLVVLVLVVTPGKPDCDQYGIFSTQPLAQAWADKLPEHVTCIFVPMVVDVPEHGNVPRKEQH